MRRWKTWLGLAISIAAIAWAVRGVEWSAVGRALREADYVLLGIVFVLAAAINVGMRAVRWKVLLRPSGTTRLSSCVSATAIGLMANNVLPARIGEFVRAYALGRREAIPAATAFGALFVERLLDGVTLVGTIYVLTWLHDFPAWVDTTVRIAFYVFSGAIAFQLWLAFHPKGFVQIVRWFSSRIFGGRFHEAIERIFVTFVDAFVLFRHPGVLALSLLLAAVQWTLISITYGIGLAAFDLLDQAGWIGAFFTDSVTSIGVAVPSSPGFVGTYQAFIVKSLEVFDVDRTSAFTYSVGFHAANYLSVTLVGAWYFFREGLSWGELERSEEEVEHDLEEEFEELGPLAGEEP